MVYPVLVLDILPKYRIHQITHQFKPRDGQIQYLLFIIWFHLPFASQDICIALFAENIIGFYKVSTASVLDWIAVSWSCILRAFVLRLLYDWRWTWTRQLSGPRESLVTSCPYTGNRIWTTTVESPLVGPSSSCFYRLSLTLCSLFDLPLGFRHCFLQSQGWWWTLKGQ